MAAGWRKHDDYNWVWFGQEMKAWRRECGWSLEEVGEAIGIRHRATMKGVELGLRGLSPAQRRTIIQAAGTRLITKRQGFNIDLFVVGAFESAGLGRQDGKQEYALPGSATPTSHPAAEMRVRRARHAAQADARWRSGDLDGWARQVFQVALASLDLGEVEMGQEYLAQVEGLPSEMYHKDTVKELHLWQGYLHLELAQYPQAVAQLLRVAPPYEHLTHFGDGGRTLLGRAYCEWGVAENNREYKERGERVLAKCTKDARQRGADLAMGFNALHLAAMLFQQGDGDRACVEALDESASLFGVSGRGESLSSGDPALGGHIALQRGKLEIDRNSLRARDYFELALHLYDRYAIAPGCVAGALQQIRALLPDDMAGLRRRLEQALTAFILSPRGESCDSLDMAAFSLYCGEGRRLARFKSAYLNVEERAKAMLDEPFVLLRSFMDGQGPEVHLLIHTRLNEARRVIAHGMLQDVLRMSISPDW